MDFEAYISSGILEAYVLGVASDEEAAILRCVVKHNAPVREALAEAERILGQLADTTARPAPDLKAAIWARLQREGAIQLPEHQSAVVSETTNQVRPFPERGAATTRVFPWKSFAIAASLLFVVSGIAFFQQRQSQVTSNNLLARQEQLIDQQEQTLDRYEAKAALLAQPGMQVINLNGVAGTPDAKALVYWNRRDHKVYLDDVALPAAPSGKQYQLWAIVSGKPVSAGLDEANPLKSLSTIPTAQAFAITLEPTGGSTTPTLEAMLVMGEVKG